MSSIFITVKICVWIDLHFLLYFKLYVWNSSLKDRHSLFDVKFRDNNYVIFYDY